MQLHYPTAVRVSHNSQLILIILSACSDSSLMSGMSTHRHMPAGKLTVCVRPNTSMKDGAFSIEWEPSCTRRPTITVIWDTVLLTSTVKPEGLLLAR